VWGFSSRECLPFPFRIARDQDAAVADSLSFVNNSLQWSVDFVRNVHDWEVNVVSDFFGRLHDLKIAQGREDGLLWVHVGNSRFSVSSFYKALTCHCVYDYPWKCIWRVRAPSKEACFCWLASLGKIFTTDNLRKCVWTLSSRLVFHK